MTHGFASKPAIFAAVLLLPLIAAMQASIAAECQTPIDRELQRLNIGPDAIGSMKVLKQVRAANPPSNFVYNAWIRLETCGKGYLVIQLTSGCVVKQSYTRGDCAVEDVTAY